ncbi:MAG: 5'/3'-nucleotidase SurE [Bacteroidetes bacterium]|nr:5'/3'-nucleotidase SurE [Bacteroidota bacterium]
MGKPLILVTNDDGFYAPGIGALIESVKEIGDVVVIAPDKPQSGMGHAITINSTLRLNKMKHYGVLEEYSCSGTPVDCVKLAVNKVLHRKPDLCVSGINHGQNASISVIYSGTMSAAVEGAIEGIPSIGFSLCDYSHEADFSPSKNIVQLISKQVLANKLPEGVCLNVNIPPVPSDLIKGIRWSRQTKGYWEEELDERLDPSNKQYFWLTGSFKNFEPNSEDTDMWAVDNNYVSIVPVQFDLTAYTAFEKMKDWNLKL